MGTVTKALTLLTYFNPHRTVIGLSELSRLSGMNKATVYRLMGELQESGFVEQMSEQRSYRLGTEVLRLAKLREAAVPMIDAGRQVLRTLSEATGETAHLSLVQGDHLVEVAHVYSTAHATRVVMDEGETLSFHGTSSGIVILAFSEPEFVDQVLSQDLMAHTPNTITCPSELRIRIAQAFERGFAQYNGGYEADVHSHAAPLFDAAGIAIGAIAVAAPATRVDAEISARTAALVIEAAAQFTQQTGGIAGPANFRTDVMKHA